MARRLARRLARSKCQECRERTEVYTVPRPPESVWNVDDRREEEFEERFGVGAEPRVTFARLSLSGLSRPSVLTY